MLDDFYRCEDYQSPAHVKWQKKCPVCLRLVGPACWDTHASHCPGPPSQRVELPPDHQQKELFS